MCLSHTPDHGNLYRGTGSAIQATSVLALLALRQEDLETARTYAAQLLTAWADNPTFDGTEHQMRILHFTWQVSQTLGLAEKNEVLLAAIQVMQRYLNHEPDPAIQNIYLQQPHHQALWQAWQEHNQKQ